MTQIEITKSIEAFCKKEGMALTTFGNKAINDTKLYARLTSGGTITFNTADKIQAFISSYSKPTRKAGQS